jgi:hypothetical protein
MGVLARRLGGRGRSGKTSNRSINSLPCTSRTRWGLRGLGRAATPRSGGAAATGSGAGACANGSPCGVRGTPRLRGTVLFFVIASRSIAYTLPTAKRGASEAREGGICHHVARRRARGAANRVRRAAGSRARGRRGAARSVLAAGGPAHHGRPAHGRARRERERLEREQPNAAPSAAPSAARRAGRQRPAVVESKGRPRASRRNLPAR